MKKLKVISLILFLVAFIFLISIFPKRVESIYISNHEQITILTEGNTTRIIVQPSFDYFSNESNEFLLSPSEWSNEVSDKIVSIVEKFNSTITGTYPDYYYTAINVPIGNHDNITTELKGLNYTVYDEEPAKLFLDKSVPLMEGRVPTWQGDLTGNGVIIAIIDGGIDDSHGDFGAPFGQPGSIIQGWRDFVGGSTTPLSDGHGTAVASIAAGSGQESNGKYRGVAPGARLLIARVSDQPDQAANAVNWSIQNGADIISMSLGWTSTEERCAGRVSPTNGPYKRLYDNINTAINSGIFYVAAAGNEGPARRTIAFPACMDNVIAVGAVINEDTREIRKWSDVDFRFPETMGFNSRVYLNTLVEQDFEGSAVGFKLGSDSLPYFSGVGTQLLLNPSSSKNLYPISCLSESGNEIYGDKYSEDPIQNINITNNQCVITAHDVFNEEEQFRRVGAICSDVQTTVQWSGWGEIIYNDAQYFESPECPAGTHVISCLTSSATSENEVSFGEDDIVQITFNGNRCFIVADDTVGAAEQKRIVGAVCSNMRTYEYWSVFDKSSEDKAEFYSPECPASTYAISCLSESAGGDVSNYGEDDIISMTIENNRCKVLVSDLVGGSEHKRKVGVICSETQPSVVWSNGEQKNSNVATFTSPTCPTGMQPISCLSESTIDNIDTLTYGEDNIEEITFENNKCRVVADDTKGEAEQKRKVEIISSDIQPVVKEGYWATRDGSSADVETFYSYDCPVNYHPISCLSETYEEGNGDNYGEDDIEEITFENNKCKVVADDTVGAAEQKRKVDVVCSNIPVDVHWSPWQILNGYDVANFYGENCGVGEHPVFCLSENAEEENEPNYGEDDIVSMKIDGNRCKVVADDTVGGYEHKRRVGTVCTSSPTYSYKTLDWVYKYNDFSTFYSPPAPQALQILVQGGYSDGGYGWNPGEKVKHDEFWSYSPSFTPGKYLHIEIGGVPLISNGKEFFDPSDPNSFYLKTWSSDFGNKDRVVIYSSRGPPLQNPSLMKPNILAPAEATCVARAANSFFGSYCNDNPTNFNYHFMGGTSAATPHVTGALALLIEANPRASYNEILGALYTGAVRRDSYDTAAGYDQFAEGVGRVDVLNSVLLIADCYSYTGSLNLNPKIVYDSNRNVIAEITAPDCFYKTAEVRRQSDNKLMCSATIHQGYAECNFNVDGIGTQTFVLSVDGNNIATDNLTINIEGDLNGDGKVDIIDIVIISIAYGSTPQNSTWNPIADINADNLIDILDLVFVAVNFGNGS